MFILNHKTNAAEHVSVLAEEYGIADPSFYLYAHGNSVYNDADFRQAAYALAAGMGRDVRFITVKGSALRNRKGELFLCGYALAYDHHFAFIV